MLCGILIGFLFRKKQFKYQSQVIMALIWILLFLLGLEVGSNEQVVKQSGKIILQAFLIATGGTLGSVIAAKILWKNILRKSK
ncbi:conserved hypothetical protein [uncultured Paludibacter sp.]|nr:conserved hypothetical protein [uncultured Paludibacter sp.]